MSMHWLEMGDAGNERLHDAIASAQREHAARRVQEANSPTHREGERAIGQVWTHVSTVVATLVELAARIRWQLAGRARTLTAREWHARHSLS